MPINRRLNTDADFQEVLDLQIPVRIFEADQLVGSGGVVIRFDDQTIVVQRSVSEVDYHSRDNCEFFALKD
ncbi:hypothetical protein D3C74_55490 [compost metagenome]